MYSSASLSRSRSGNGYGSSVSKSCEIFSTRTSIGVAPFSSLIVQVHPRGRPKIGEGRETYHVLANVEEDQCEARDYPLFCTAIAGKVVHAQKHTRPPNGFCA